MWQVRGYSARGLTRSHIWLFGHCLRFCAVFGFICWFYFLPLCLDDLAETRFTRPWSCPSLLMGVPGLRMKPGKRRRETGWRSSGSIQPLGKFEKNAMVETQKAQKAKWGSHFLSFSCDSLRTLQQHAAEYLSHSVYHSWNVSWCFKWLGHLSCMVRRGRVGLHREGEMVKGSKRGGIERRGTGVCACVCAHAWMCIIVCINHILHILSSGNSSM